MILPKDNRGQRVVTVTPPTKDINLKLVCVRAYVCYREQGTQPVHLLRILWSSVLVESDHELLTETHK